MCASSRVAGDAWGGNHGPGPGPVCRVLVCFVGFRFVGGVCVASTLSVYCDCVSVCAVCVCVISVISTAPYARGLMQCVLRVSKKIKKRNRMRQRTGDAPRCRGSRQGTSTSRRQQRAGCCASLRGATIIPSVVMRYQLGMWRRLRLQVCSGGASEGAQRVTHGRHRHP